MAGEDVNDVSEIDQTFRYANLEFGDSTHQSTYEHFQRQVTNNKTAHTRYINNSKGELSTTVKKTQRNDALLKMVLIEKEYVVKESQAKLDKIIENNREFVNFVSGHDFNEQQSQSFEAFTDALNREALNKHMVFIEDVANIAENFQPSPAPSTSSEGNPLPKFVNRPDLAEGCTLLSEENNYKETLDFLEKIEL